MTSKHIYTEGSSKVYYVDLPDPQVQHPEDPWVNVGIFDSKQDAINYLVTTYYIPRKIAPFFISCEKD